MGNIGKLGVFIVRQKITIHLPGKKLQLSGKKLQLSGKILQLSGKILQSIQNSNCQAKAYRSSKTRLH